MLNVAKLFVLFNFGFHFGYCHVLNMEKNSVDWNRYSLTIDPNSGNFVVEEIAKKTAFEFHKIQNAIVIANFKSTIHQNG